MPSLAAQTYLDAAEKIAETAAGASNFVTCANGTQDAACATSFINSFGKQVYRRPLAADDTARYTALYEKAISSGYDFKTGIEWIVFAMLQSQQFLYRFELGSTPTGNYAKPTQYEIASRLSFIYLQSMPDAALLDGRRQGRAGDAGTDRGAGAAHAGRSQGRAPPRLLRAVARHRHAARASCGTGRSTRTSIRRCRRCSRARRARSSPISSRRRRAPSTRSSPRRTRSPTRRSPGTTACTGPTGSTYEKVDAPGRAGVLTQGMLLAHDKATRTSIVRRGLKIRTDVLCQIVPAPPPDVDLSSLDKTATGVSQRERLEQHRTQASCAGCHTLMDPIGVVFEGFDAVGRARTIDEIGLPVVIASELSGTRDADGPMANPAELGQKLAQSEQVRGCYVTNNFRFFYGREVEQADACSLARLLVDFKTANYNLTELLVSLTRTDAFLYRGVTP